MRNIYGRLIKIFSICTARLQYILWTTGYLQGGNDKTVCPNPPRIAMPWTDTKAKFRCLKILTCKGTFFGRCLL